MYVRRLRAWEVQADEWYDDVHKLSCRQVSRDLCWDVECQLRDLPDEHTDLGGRQFFYRRLSTAMSGRNNWRPRWRRRMHDVCGGHVQGSDR